MSNSSFDPTLWLRAFTKIGGGYVLMSGRRLYFAVRECDGEALPGVMAQIVGQPERQEAVKQAIELHQHGEVQS